MPLPAWTQTCSACAIAEDFFLVSVDRLDLDLLAQLVGSLSQAKLNHKSTFPGRIPRATRAPYLQLHVAVLLSGVGVLRHDLSVAEFAVVRRFLQQALCTSARASSLDQAHLAFVEAQPLGVLARKTQRL